MRQKTYHTIKNIMIGSAVAVMYYGNVSKNTDDWLRIIGTIVMFVAVIGLLREADKYLALAVKTYLPAKEFEQYKNWMIKKIRAKAEQGADKEYISDYVINVILHEEQYEFKSSQVMELLDLVNKVKEKSA